jgi:arylsulfatase A-like enzyme
VGALLEALDRTGRRDDTLVVLQADHGELFYRHGIYFDHHGLYPGNTHVPLIVRHPEIAAGRVSGLVAHEDAAPTVLEFCGVEPPPAMTGQSWAQRLKSGDPAHAPQRDFAVLEECTWQMKWGLRTQDELFILSREPDFYGNPPRERYDLAADPQALRNVAGEDPRRTDLLEARLEEWIAAEMARHGLEQDPLVAHGLTLGKRWQSPAVAG